MKETKLDTNKIDTKEKDKLETRKERQINCGENEFHLFPLFSLLFSHLAEISASPQIHRSVNIDQLKK